MAKRRINGEGSVYAQRDSEGNVIRWIAQIAVGVNENGSIKRKRTYAQTKTEAVQLLEKMKFDCKTGILIDKSSITLHDLGAQIERERFEFNEIGESAYYRSMETLKRLSKIYDLPLQKITPQILQRFFVSEQHYAQSTLNKEYILLNRIFKEATKRGFIAENPLEDMRRPRSKKRQVEIRAMTVEEQQKFVSVLQSEKINHRTQMLLSLYTGMRMGEVHALEVKHIDFRKHCIYVRSTIHRGEKGEAILGGSTKTKAGQRTLPMSPQVEALLKEFIGDQKSGLLFVNKKNQPLSANVVNCQFQRILEKYDIQDPMIDGKLTAHSLRHTYATRCVEASMPPKVLQTLLGHTDISITLNTYCNAFDQFQAEGLAKFADYMEQQGLLL